MNQSDASREDEPIRDDRPDVEKAQTLIDRFDPRYCMLRTVHVRSIHDLMESCNTLRETLRDHVWSIDDKLKKSLNKTAQTLYNLGNEVSLKFEKLQDSDELSRCHRQPGSRAEDPGNGDDTEVYHPSEEEINFQRALDAAMEEFSRLTALAHDACAKWNAYKAHVNTTVMRSALRELEYTEPACESRKKKIRTLKRCYGSTEAEEAVGDDAAGESTTLETEPPQIPGATNASNLSGEDSGSPSQGGQGQSRRIRPRLE